MSIGDQFESEAGRGLEIVCGVVLLAFTGLIGTGAVLIPPAGKWHFGSLIASALFALIAWGLGTLGLRLLLGQARVKKNLFPRVGLFIGSAIFALGGTGMFVLCVVDKEPRGLFAGLGTYLIAYYAWRAAKNRGPTP